MSSFTISNSYLFPSFSYMYSNITSWFGIFPTYLYPSPLLKLPLTFFTYLLSSSSLPFTTLPSTIKYPSLSIGLYSIASSAANSLIVASFNPPIYKSLISPVSIFLLLYLTFNGNFSSSFTSYLILTVVSFPAILPLNTTLPSSSLNSPTISLFVAYLYSLGLTSLISLFTLYPGIFISSCLISSSATFSSSSSLYIILSSLFVQSFFNTNFSLSFTLYLA